MSEDQPKQSQTTAYCMICGGPAPCETHTFHGEVPANKTTLERVAGAIREEIVRQQRENERAKCPAGAAFYEENVSPYLIAQRVLEAMNV